MVSSKKSQRAAFEGSDAMRQSKFMKTRWLAVWGVITVLTAGMDTGSARGQEKNAATTLQPLVYEVSREVAVVGKVLGYGANFPVASMGPHVRLQTSTAIVDVQLGDVRLLEANHMAIESGDTLRIIGAVVGLGSGKQFVARIVQKGTQAIVVRTTKGFPLSPAAPINAEKARSQGGVR
jgi:hypothetical protein